ncbi:hypothetical protein B0H94_102175 [Salsuginibacillus halophilus]|uniref:Uncharacterized protein n=1 Tax=Salsuginibacillus halophilus TaxID=517424 RepID=A0A2P8HXG6_9BACI|nr:hypothetical protein [Salsuginibacillus halophilus]PSL50898.1 hypothetical protein B0H94_102175 [Salsuginibacillus halophilus]
MLAGGLFIIFHLAYAAWMDKQTYDKTAHENFKEMNKIMVPASLLPLVAGLWLIYMFPMYYVHITLIAALFGTFAGGWFGRKFGADGMLYGSCSGFMAGIMAPMIGTMSSHDPLLLGLVQLLHIWGTALTVLPIDKNP